MKRILTDQELNIAAAKVANAILAISGLPGFQVRIYPVPRGGIPAAYLVTRHLDRLGVRNEIVDQPGSADVIVDDLVDSGATAARFASYGKPFLALITKATDSDYPLGEWLVFPWEGSSEGSIHDAVTRLLQYVGEDPERGGLLETPTRVAKAWDHWCSGYKQSIPDLLKMFEDGAEVYNEMIVETEIPFYSHCEHHLAPFFGTVAFAYVPNKKIVGLSKMSRLVDAFAHRLQVQERITTQIVDAFMEHVQPKGAACIVRARHLCMESRGIRKQGVHTTTSALRGCFLDASVRAEFLQLVKP